eukprot:m.312470 g.312470  ORF g.312470 m.312470 type:complete len:59 (+) comp267365_c0_seq1:245-421(+)
MKSLEHAKRCLKLLNVTVSVVKQILQNTLKTGFKFDDKNYVKRKCCCSSDSQSVQNFR